MSDWYRSIGYLTFISSAGFVAFYITNTILELNLSVTIPVTLTAVGLVVMLFSPPWSKFSDADENSSDAERARAEAERARAEAERAEKERLRIENIVDEERGPQAKPENEEYGEQIEGEATE